MFKLLGTNEILRNLLLLCRPFLNDKPNTINLKKAYREFLQKVQPKLPIKSNVDLSFIYKKEEILTLLEIFQEKSILDDFDSIFNDQFQSDVSEQHFTMLKDALTAMDLFSRDFAEIIKLVIHTFFTFPSKIAGGGSTSAAIGCIWIDPRPHWIMNDVLEFLVHETTHNLVFIDELCFTHYCSYGEISKTQNFAQSAILNKPRPLDKVFHSIIVSTEVLLFREQHFGHPEVTHLHPPSDILLEQTINSIDSIKKLENLMTDRAKLLVELCIEKLKNLNIQHLCGR